MRQTCVWTRTGKAHDPHPTTSRDWVITHYYPSRLNDVYWLTDHVQTNAAKLTGRSAAAQMSEGYQKKNKINEIFIGLVSHLMSNNNWWKCPNISVFSFWKSWHEFYIFNVTLLLCFVLRYKTLHFITKNAKTKPSIWIYRSSRLSFRGISIFFLFLW